VLIRPLTLSDLPWVLDLEQRIFPRPWSRGTFLIALANPQQIFFVATVGEQCLGYIGLWRMYDCVHITNIAVEPDVRRQGIAWQLLGEAQKWACGAAMTLEVRPSNTAAKALYKKFGFQAAGIRPGYYEDNGEDALIMWKEITCENTGD
jgi:ribosomal-protein-alanine N-acetyltransferase